MTRMLRGLGALWAFALVLALASGAPLRVRAAAAAPASVTIAYLPGIGYANLIVMKEQGVLEKRFPQTKIEWKVLASGAAVRDAIIAGEVQIGCNAIGPFLIGWDRGVPYRLAGALSEMDLWMVARDPAIKTLRDIKPDMKIGMAGLDAMTAIVLRKAAADRFGNPSMFDGQIVAIDHPDGLVALQTGQLALHFTSPPFEFEEVAAGGHVVLRSSDVMGRSTFIAAFMTQKLYDDSPEFAQAFYAELLRATAFIKAHPAQTAAMLAHDAGGKTSAADFQRWIERPDVHFGTTPHGYLRYAKFMKSIGMISKEPPSMRDIEMPMLGGAGD